MRVVIPNEDLPFKMFIFEGKDGNYKGFHPLASVGGDAFW